MHERVEREGCKLRFEIGGITFSLSYRSPKRNIWVPDSFGNFVTDKQPEVVLQVHNGSAPALGFGDTVFEAGAVWSLHQDGGKWIFSFPPPASDGPSRQLHIFDSDFCTGDIYIQADGSAYRPLPFPLGHVVGQLLMSNLLARGRGVLFHACGVKDGDRGVLFVGASGAGKSTIARLWKGRSGVTVLNDDRIIVRRRDGRLRIYGTPWHGDELVASPEAVPLERIFLIRHASGNRAVPLMPSDVVSRLLVCSFPTFWDAEGMAFTLRFLDELSQTVPCYELGFVPGESVMDFVQCLM